MDRRGAADLGRRLSLLEAGGAAVADLYAATCRDPWTLAVAVLAGPPGVGKSTILAALAKTAGTTDAFLLVDPSSPKSGGAVLADRARLPERAGAGPFVRSLAARGHPGGAAGALWPCLRLLNASGFRRAIVESVGVGQVADSLRGLADLLVLVLAPGAGDAHQAVKSGLLEQADLVVVNQADRPGAEALAATLAALADAKPLLASATTGLGMEAIAAALEEIPLRPDRERRLAEARDLAVERFFCALPARLSAWEPTANPLEMP
ncbi:methylmalonyl Co-A mutase-associated GTPase MeaB [bacterium]|nr:methylmalonyl Co-A mutase-associated GTPase MeaB [bacterium]